MLRSLVRVQLAPLWGCSSAGRAPALQAGGRGFESHHLHSSSAFEVGHVEDVVEGRRRAPGRCLEVALFAEAEEVGVATFGVLDIRWPPRPSKPGSIAQRRAVSGTRAIDVDSRSPC